MAKTVVLVGHCGPDSSYLRMAVSRAISGAKVVMADDDSELRRFLDDGAELLLLNRQLDYGFTEDLGVDLIKRLRAEYPAIKMMLVSNYAEAQAQAIAAGALRGFGKREIGTAQVTEILKSALAEIVKA